MVKTEGEFLTKFISESGTRLTNNDYFGYVTLNNCGIWVIADGYDENEGAKVASKLAVETAIDCFMNNPEYSSHNLKEIVEKVHNTIKSYQKDNINLSMMHTSLLIFISDYYSYMYVNIGNTRLYHLRNGYIINKSKDDSISQVLLDEHLISEKDLNKHRQNNDLLQAIGDYGELNIKVNENPIALYDNDVICLSTIGIWGNLLDKEIEVEISRYSNRKDMLNSIEQKIIDNKKEIENYTFVIIDINKTAEKKIYYSSNQLTKFIIQLLFLSIVSLITVNLTIFYQKNKLFKEIEKYRYKINDEIIKKNFNNVYNLLDMKMNKYDKIIDKSKGILGFLTRGEKDLFKAENEKHRIKENLQEIQLIEEEFRNILQANKLFNNDEYSKAMDIYKISYYKLGEVTYKADEFNISSVLSSLENRINSSTKLEEAKQLEKKGDLFMNASDLKNAKENYKEAHYIFLTNGKPDYVTKLESKLDEISSKEMILYNGAVSNENKGDIYAQNNFELSLESYSKAKEIYYYLGDDNKVNLLNDKIIELNNRINEKKLQEELEQIKMNELLLATETNYNNMLKEKEKELTYEKEKLEIMNNKFDEIEISILDNQVSFYIEQGDNLYNYKKYKNSLENYKKAKDKVNDIIYTLQSKNNNINGSELYFTINKYQDKLKTIEDKIVIAERKVNKKWWQIWK